LRIIFAGTPEAAIPSLTALLDSEHEVIAVLTRPDSKSGRGRALMPSPVSEVANQKNIPVLKYANLKDSKIHDELKRFSPNAIAVVAYGALVPSELLKTPKHGWINLHFSLLPAWRGAAPVPYAIRFGDEITGATTFQIDEGLDTGPVYGVLTEQIKQNDTADTLLTRLSIAGAQLLVQTLSGIESGQLRAMPQSRQDVSLAPKISVSDCQIDWRQPALSVGRHIRAFTSEPGAWTTFDGDRIQIGPIEILETVLAGAPGELIVSKHEVFVTTGSNSIRLSDVKAAGKREMPASDWARGIRLESGQAFSLTSAP
jgi:methionyl-tRNA formyltransferase